MAQHTPCEQCHRVGLVRLERIIRGTKVTLSYYCGACDHAWQIDTADPRKAVRLPTIRSIEDRRRRA